MKNEEVLHQLILDKEEFLSSSTTLDLSNVEEITTTEVVNFARQEQALETLTELNIISESDSLQIVYEGDHSDVSIAYASVEQTINIETITDIQVSVDSTLLVDIPTVIDDIISES
ncbi:MAG: hypothetical protein COB99_06400 [Sulfurimonas sp.]|nr:MAG: hypothetical protein COB99_06400 [Sulfurimonas sp.]